MKSTLDAKRIYQKYVNSFSAKLDEWLDEVKKYIDQRTPELTWDLISHNKIKKPSLSGFILSWSVYNDLGEYEMDVERWKWETYKYHKYPEWVSKSIKNKSKRDIIKVGDGAHMFRDWFAASKDILINLLMWNGIN